MSLWSDEARFVLQSDQSQTFRVLIKVINGVIHLGPNYASCDPISLALCPCLNQL